LILSINRKSYSAKTVKQVFFIGSKLILNPSNKEKHIKKYNMTGFLAQFSQAKAAQVRHTHKKERAGCAF